MDKQSFEIITTKTEITETFVNCCYCAMIMGAKPSEEWGRTSAVQRTRFMPLMSFHCNSIPECPSTASFLLHTILWHNKTSALSELDLPASHEATELIPFPQDI